MRRNSGIRAFREANLEIVRERERLKWANNPTPYRAKGARRRATRAGATPSWVDHETINAIYRLAVFMDLTVDHIEPLHGVNACGLHVPWNLQLLSASENSAKGNRRVS